MNSTQTDYTKLTTKELTIELKKEVEIKEENHQEFIKHHWVRIKEMISQLKNGTLKDITDLTYEIMLLEREAEARGFNQYKIQLFQERLEEQEKKEKESK